jgi:diacylglycerol kinase (ATP)
MRTLLLHNPTAGDGRATADRLEAALSRSGCSVASCSTNDIGYKTALGETWDLVAVAGGDGTVAKAARYLRDRGIPLAILPTGTANNVAYSLELVGNAEEIAASLRGAPVRPLDLGSAKGPWGERGFIEAVGLGAVGPAILKSNPKPPFEHRIRLGREALSKAIAEAPPYKLALTVDGERIAGDFLFVEILNLRFSGPRLPIAFFAEPGDQMLDIVLLPEDQRTAMQDWIKEAPEESPPPVRVITGRNVAVVWQDAPLRLDDRIFPPEQGPHVIEIGLEPESLRILCPQPHYRPSDNDVAFLSQSA